MKPGTVNLNSSAADVIPFSDSEELVRNGGLPASALIEDGSDHRLADLEPLEAMLGYVKGRSHKMTLQKLNLPTTACRKNRFL